MLGLEVSPIVQYVIAFAIVAALLALFAVVLRRIGGKRFAMAGQDRGRGRQPRLGIVDVYDLDKQRQLVLLRRDNVEHLVMLGGPNDLVVESNIVRVPMGRAPVAEVASERAGQGEVGQGNAGQGNAGQEPGRAIADASIAAVAAAPVLAAMQAAAGQSTARAVAPREAEPVLREPAIQQRPQPQVAQPAPQPAAPKPVPPQPVPPQPIAPQPAPPPIRPQPPAPLADIERSPAAQQSAATSAPIPPVPSPPPSAPAPASPFADLEAVMRAKPRPAEPATAAPSEPKRSLFGFGRATEAPPAPPAFPPRPRATPVAPDFAPQRTPPKFSQTDEKLANAGSPSIESDKAPAARKTDAEPKLSRSLDDAILADMARQLESALERPRSPISPSAAPPVALKPAAAAPPTPASHNPLVSNAVNAGPSEPKSYQPVATAAAAVATVAAVASVFRSASTASRTSPVPVPPRPYGGESSPQPSSLSDNREDDREFPEEKTVEAAENSVSETVSSSDAYNEPGPSDAGAKSDDVSSIASSEEGDGRERGDLVADDQVVTGSDAGSDVQSEPTSPKPDGNANGSTDERFQPSVSVEVRSDADADAETSSVGDNADDERRQPAAPVIDPFSVDEIEAEFARLLGRAVDKDPKNT